MPGLPATMVRFFGSSFPKRPVRFGRSDHRVTPFSPASRSAGVCLHGFGRVGFDERITTAHVDRCVDLADGDVRGSRQVAAILKRFLERVGYVWRRRAGASICCVSSRGLSRPCMLAVRGARYADPQVRISSSPSKYGFSRTGVGFFPGFARGRSPRRCAVQRLGRTRLAQGEVAYSVDQWGLLHQRAEAKPSASTLAMGVSASTSHPAISVWKSS